jgi:hypothetical protein
MIGKPFAMFGLSLLMVVAMTGCKSMGMDKDSTGTMSEAPMESAPMESAVVSVTNQGAFTFLRGHGGGVMVMQSSGAHACEQCKSDAAKFFSSGMLTEKCSVCGASRFATNHGHN